MAETNEQRKKRRVVSNPAGPALPPSVVPRVVPPTVPREIPAAGIRQVVAPSEPPVGANQGGPPNLKDRSLGKEFGRSVESGVQTLRGLSEGFQGAVKGTFGDEEGALRHAARAEANFEVAGEDAPQIERVQDVRLGEEGGLGRAAQYVAGVAGKQGIIFAPILAAAAVGSVAAPLVGGSAVVGGAIGAVGTGIGLETGGTFADIANDPESIENLGVQGVSALSLGSGTVGGSLELVPGLSVLKRVGLLKPFQRAVRRNLGQRVARGALTQAAVEGGTEAAQTIVQRTAAKFANENREILGEEGLDELLNATVAGAIFGAGIGGITGIPGGKAHEPGSVEDQVDLEETLDILDETGGRSSDVEADIDDLGEFGQEIRDARVRPSDSQVFEDPVGMIDHLLRTAQTEGNLTERMQESLYIAVRELEQPEQQLLSLLERNGYTPEQAETIALEVLTRADEQEIETIEDLATSPGQDVNIDDVDPSEDAENFDQFDEGFQHLHLTRNHIFRSRNGKLGLLPAVNISAEDAQNRIHELEQEILSEAGDAEQIQAMRDELDAQLAQQESQTTEGVEQKNTLLQAARSQVAHVENLQAQLEAARKDLKAVGRQNVLEKNVAQLGKDFPDIEFDTVGLGDAVAEELGPQVRNDPERLNRALLNIANEKRNEAGYKVESTGELNENDPLEFLNRWKVIRRTVADTSLTGADQLRLTNFEIRGGSTTGGFVTTTEAGETAVQQPKGKNIVADRKPVGEADFVVVTKQKKKDPKTKEVVEVDGNETVDAVALTNAMLSKLKTEGFRSVDDIANAFFNGLAALGNLGIQVDTSKISDDTVVYKKGGRDVSYGEVSKKGASRIRARLRGLKAEERRLKDEIVSINQRLPKTGSKEKQRRMNFLIKKMRRRIKKIPSDIEGMSIVKADEQGRLLDLRDKLKNVGDLLDVEDAFLDDLRNDLADIDDLLFDFRNRGINTMAVEELAGVRNRMDEVIQATLDERTRRKQARSPEGSFDAGGEFAIDKDTGGPLNRQEEIDLQKAVGEAWSEAADNDVRDDGPARARKKGTDSKKMEKLRRKTREVGDELAAQLNLENTIIFTSVNEVRGALRAIDPERWGRMVKGTLYGTVIPPGHANNDSGNYIILINPFLENENVALETMAHEIGHVVFHQHYINADATTKAAILREYHKWREIAGKPNTPADIAALSKKGFNVAQAILDSYGMRTETMAELQARNPKQAEYILSFEEWFADNVSRWVVKQPQPKKGLSKLEKFFEGVADKITLLYNGMIKKFGFRPATSVKKFLDNLVHVNSNDEIEILSQDFASILKSAGLDSDTPAVAGVLQTLDPFGHATPYMLRKAFKQTLSEEERNTLYRYFNRTSVKRRLKELVGTSEQKDMIENNALHATVFGYQMWIAGKFKLQTRSQEATTAAGITEANIQGPVSQFVHDIFTNMFDLLASKLGFVQESEKAIQILDAVRGGYIDMRKAGQQRWSVTASVRDTLIQRAVQNVNDAFNHMRPVFDKAVGITQQRMLDTGIPGLRKIANGYYTAVNTEGNPEAFFEARRAQIGLFMNSYTALTEELHADPELKADVLAALRNPKKSKDPDVKRITAAIFKFNRRFRNYLVEAGLDVGDKGPNYFPWVWDPRKVQEENDFVRGLLTDKRFEKEMNEWLKRRNDEIAAKNQDRINKGGLAKLELEDSIDMDTLINEIMVGLQQNEGYADGELNPATAGTTPWFSGMHKRALGFLTESGKLTEAERNQFDGLFSDQLDLIMMTYVRQGVKRAEYARRFGARSEKLLQWLQEAKDEGASKAQMDQAYKYIDAMNGVIGENTNRRIYDLVGVGHRKGEVINPTFRTFSSIMMVVQNLAVLPLATLTSLVDPVGIMVRSQDMNATMAALRAGADEIARSIKGIVGNDPKAQRSELRKLAEGMGTIEDHMTNEALEWEFGSTYLSPRLKAVNEFFFKAIGLTQWTRLTRIMALAGGKEFIKRHVQRPVDERGVTGARSERFLKQLGITAEDVRFDNNGDLIILSRTEREGTEGQRLSKEEIARDNRVRNALNRFVDEAILRPTAANRPTWASDPNYMLVVHLKSFMFTFHDRLLRRAFTELEHGNAAPLILMSAFIPAMLFADILRDLIRFGLDGNPGKSHWGLGDHMWSATQRSGLTGIGQLMVDARQDVQFGGLGYESMVGPTADGIVDLGGLFAEDDEQQWRAFTRNLPANSAWRHWFENGFEDDNRVSFQN